MKIPAILIVAVAFQCCFASPNLAQNELPSDSLKWKSKGMFNDLFSGHQRRINKGHEAESRRLVGFSWKTCNQTASAIDLKTLSISPDPLSFPGTLTIATDFIIKIPLNAPLKVAAESTETERIQLRALDKADVDLKLGPVSVPCVDDFGSCTYADACELLHLIGSQCPDPLTKIGINCRCPFKANSYSLRKTSFNINALEIPTGDYHITANVTHGDYQVLCLDLDINIK